MDPNTTLENIRRLVKLLLEQPMLAGRQAEAALDLVEKVSTLDEWMSRGGALPKAWQPRSEAQTGGASAGQTCPDCGALPGEPCEDPGVPDEAKPGYHVRRIDRANP